ncbi:MAG: ThiF family adenylyltransferase [Planctomycetales bacterium]|nr:ThiF family adenylyltransferase [Planctomycetales bacterium]
MDKDELWIDDDDRYSRLRLIAWWDQRKLAEAKILVVGAGALGNEVLKNLALLGVGRIVVVDFDQIEQSNLTRSVLFRRRDCGRSKAEVAAEALADMNPDTVVTPLSVNVLTEIGLGTFRDVDVVIGCLDNREARLWVNRCCWKVGTPRIDGGIQEINGVVKVFVPPRPGATDQDSTPHACYECAMTEMDYRLINLRYSCPLLRNEDIQSGKVPTAPTISSMIGGLQTQEALKLIHGLPVSAGEAVVYNGVSNQFYKTRFQFREDCLSHETYAQPVVTPLSARTNTVRDLFAWIARHDAAEPPFRLVLDRDLVRVLNCEQCGWSREVMRPIQLVGMTDSRCPQCEHLARPSLIHAVDSDSPLADERLSRLGVPSYDIVRVASQQGEHVYLLAADRDL